MSDKKPYIVSARKYRPATFRSVVGQKTLSSTLKNAIGSKRLAQAYLFCGPRGVGKTSCARIFAKTINCLNPDSEGEACGKCESCVAIEKGNSFDLVELDAASNNSVDDIRAITEQVNVPPQNGRYRIFIIDEVHMLSNAAFNAFLKTLEEPPANVVFILATTEKHKVIPTILSRCQIYDFKRITVNDIVDHLDYVAREEGVKADRNALGVIALKADGAMRDALSLFDQVSASTGGNITYENTLENLNVLDHDYYFKLVDAFRDGDVAGSLLLYKEIRDRGFDSLFFINGVASHIRDLMVACDPRTVSLLETSDEIGKKYIEQAGKLPIGWYYSALKVLNDCDFNYRTASNKRLLVELTLIRLCQLLNQDKRPFDEPDGKKPLANPVSTSAAPRKEEPSTEANTTFTKPEIRRPEQRTVSTTPANTQAKGRPQSFRLSSSDDMKLSASSVDKRTEPFTYSQFMEAWNAFIDNNPSLHILVNAMRASSPKEDVDFTYHIVVDHPAQIQAFELAMNKLLEFLRDHLKNDMLTLKIELNENKKVEKQLPPKEFLKKIIKSNPELGRFLTEIEAEIV